MNFVQLLFELQLENDFFSNYTDSHLIKIEKKLKVERQLNSEINFEISDKLLNAIKEFPKELEEFVKKESLVNVFLTNIPKRTYYTLFEELNFKAFFNKYLEDDLLLIFKRKITNQNYNYLERLLAYEPYFSSNFIDVIQEELENKLSYANTFYSDKAFIKHKEFLFLTNISFFKFINFFNNYTIEVYLTNIYNKAVDEYNKTKQLKHPIQTLIAFSYYNPKNNELRQLLKNNKKHAKDRLKGLTGSNGSVFYIIGRVAIVFFFIFKFFYIFNKTSSSPKFKYPIEQHDIREQFKSVSNYLGNTEKKLKIYIQDNELDQEGAYKLIKNIKTGDIPFDIKMPEFNIDRYKKFYISNNTNHDLIVLEYEILNSVNIYIKHIKLLNARFIKSKDSLQMSNYDDYENTLFSFYLGDSLSTYKNPFLNETKELFKNDKHTRESRFLSPIKGTNKTLNMFYKLKNNTQIYKKGAVVSIKSIGLKYNNRPNLPIFIKKNKHDIYLLK